MPGPGSHRSLTSINTEIAAPTRLSNPDISPARKSRQTLNYAKRYRAGLRVGTSMTEGTANFLVNQRMNKAQQMRWSRRGADLLLQVRCAVYNGAFGSGFGKLFEPTSNTVQQSPLAA
jgi:hypothetical protein